MADEDMVQLLSQKFETRDKLIEDVRRFYASKGYALSIKDSRKDKYVVLGCDRGGNYRNRRKEPEEKRKKVSRTRLINCPFEIRGKKLDGGYWVLIKKNDAHNHEPSDDMSGHPLARSLTNEEILDIQKMTMAGIQPSHILSSLRQKNPHLRAVARTIYNLQAKIQRDSLDDRSLIQGLFEELDQEGFTYNHLSDDDGNLTHVFFAHPKSIMLSKTYSTVFVMDCTCKTNKYGMQLLDIVGMSSSNRSFYSCFAFLKNEREEDYIWALQVFKSMLGIDSQPSVIVSDQDLALKNAIEVIFPSAAHLLCNLKKNLMKLGSLCKCYTRRKMILSNTFKIHGFQKKKKFASAWTEKYKHFGNRASSRAEVAHVKLKRYLQVSTGNLRVVKNKICLAIENEFQEIKTQLESERIRTPHMYNVPYFRDLISNVSIFSLRELHKQYEMAKFGTLKPICTGNFSSTMGLPCAHMMGDWNGAVLPLDSIHSQWRIDTKFLASSSGETEALDDVDEMKDLLNQLRDLYHEWPAFQKREVKKKIHQILNMARPSIHEPTIQTRKRKRGKSKKKKGHGSSSTRRDPSGFEIVEAMRNKTATTGMIRTYVDGFDLNAPPALD